MQQPSPFRGGYTSSLSVIPVALVEKGLPAIGDSTAMHAVMADIYQEKSGLHGFVFGLRMTILLRWRGAVFSLCPYIFADHCMSPLQRLSQSPFVCKQRLARRYLR